MSHFCLYLHSKLRYLIPVSVLQELDYQAFFFLRLLVVHSDLAVSPSPGYFRKFILSDLMFCFCFRKSWRRKVHSYACSHVRDCVSLKVSVRGLVFCPISDSSNVPCPWTAARPTVSDRCCVCSTNCHSLEKYYLTVILFLFFLLATL
jgi:hypothetical protein